MSKRKTVLDLVTESLKRGGYDGLFLAGECACEVSDLAPCHSYIGDCEPGYYTICPSGCSEHGFHISREKRRVDDSNSA